MILRYLSSSLPSFVIPSSKMTHQGRCSASEVAFLATTILLPLLLNLQTTHAATTFTVGDTSGWDFSVGNWPTGKKFKAGDTLVFNYDPSVHNMVVVDANGYNSCTASATSMTYTSKKDRVKLSKGPNYFICSIPGHCDGGLKLSVNAS